MVLAPQAFAQQEAAPFDPAQFDVANGKEVYRSGGVCLQCHGWDGAGTGRNPRAPRVPNLRETPLDAELLREVIVCGRPYTEMPYHDDQAYSDGRCHDMTLADCEEDDAPTRGRTLDDHEIDDLLAYLVTEVAFACDDEMAYGARAMELEYEVLTAGTSAFAHDVVLSVLIDEAGTVQGLRILTDPRAPQRDRRRVVTLMRNLLARYDRGGLSCEDLPLASGEMAVGATFTKQTCEGTDSAGEVSIRLDSRCLRKRGQEAVNRGTREVNSTYFESFTRLEMVRLPFATTPPPVLE